MKLSDVELPSNRKFGFFFTTVFFMAAAYSYHVNSATWLYILGAIGVAFFVVTIIRADALLPLNKLWMKFGLLLGIIVSPIVMGVIFLGVFTPIAILMRTLGRDELRLKFKKEPSYWITRRESIKAEFFNNQF